MSDGLTLLEKLEDFIVDVYPVINSYPKAEKFTLQTQTKNCIYEMMDCVEKANKSTAKKSAMYEADIKLSRMRRLFRLAHRLHYIDMRKYGKTSKQLTEIGKILGGWIKWANG